MKKMFQKIIASSNNPSISKISFATLIAFCFFIYTPSLKIPGVIMDIITIGIPLFYIILNIKILTKFKPRQWMSVIAMLLLIAMSIVIPQLYETMDFSYFTPLAFYFKRGITYVALLCLVIKRHGGEHVMNYFMLYFALTHVIYVISTILLVIVPGWQDVWFTISSKGTFFDSLSALDASRYMFRIGWQGFAGFHETLCCTFSAMFLMYLRYGTRSPAISAKWFVPAFTICFLGNMFYGRVGLVATLVTCSAAFIHWNRNRIKHIVFATVTLVILLALGGAILKTVPEMSDWYEWMSSPFTNLITTGDVGDSSFNKLQKMWQVDITEDTVMYGDGRYTNDGLYYMNTDVGFLRNILFWGLIGFILSYGLTVYEIMGLRRISKVLMIQAFTVFLMFEYKGAAYYVLLPLIFVVELAYDIESKEKEKWQQLGVSNEEG